MGGSVARAPLSHRTRKVAVVRRRYGPPSRLPNAERGDEVSHHGDALLAAVLAGGRKLVRQPQAAEANCLQLRVCYGNAHEVIPVPERLLSQSE